MAASANTPAPQITGVDEEAALQSSGKVPIGVDESDDLLKAATKIYKKYPMFNRFNDLNIFNLLRLQADVHRLREKVAGLPGEGENLEAISVNGNEPRGPEFDALLDEIGTKLKEYSESPDQNALDRPQSSILERLKKQEDEPQESAPKSGRNYPPPWGDIQPPDPLTLDSAETNPNKMLWLVLSLFYWLRVAYVATVNQIRRSWPVSPRRNGGSKSKAQAQRESAFSNRLAMAFFGGIALIGPTLIMSLHPSLNTSLITTCVATSLFALVLAIGAEDSTGKDVLASTAAYAAVLVVFIGTSMASTTGS